MIQHHNVTVMHAIQLTLSLTCLIMHFSTDKWAYEYQFDPLFSLTFVGCTVALLAIMIIDSMRHADTWDRDQYRMHCLTRAEIIFDFIAFFMFVTCGVINVVYDNRPEPLVKGTLSMINGVCFLLDAVVFNPCQYRWGEELASDYEERLNERRAFYRLATYYHAPAQINP